MALDTRNKRMAMMAFHLPWLLRFPLADGSNFATQGERKIVLGLNPGITSGAPVLTLSTVGDGDVGDGDVGNGDVGDGEVGGIG